MITIHQIFRTTIVFCLIIALIIIIKINFGNDFDDDTFDTYSNRSGSICCLVLTSPKYFFTRARAINSTWGLRCDGLFFISEYAHKNMTYKQKQFAKRIPIAPIDNIQPGYQHLTEKTVLAFLFAYKNYFHAFDWFVKADDDTYLIVEYLKEFLKLQDPSEPVTFGYNFKVLVDNGYHSGGASYVLSREALKRFYQAHQNSDNKTCRKDGGMEDIEIAKCLREHGVYVGRSTDEENRDLFHPLSFSAHFLGLFPKWLKTYAENPLKKHYNCCSDRSVSYHYMKPQEIYLMDFLLYGLNS
ncbi:hypothetical protein I4U23_025056 [Adineta vaga]|nr:hypothetical protein I4U23_025056 [Adineta vaga]